jgi:uncharacterized cupredoxin-like copper-binding protein
MKYLFHAFLLLGVSAILPNAVMAQENTATPTPALLAAIQCEDTVSGTTPLLEMLFDPSPISVDAGSTLEFLGTLANISSQPLSDVTVYARVYQSDVENSQNITQLDEFMVVDAMQLAGNSDVPIQATWDVPNTLSPGEYYINLYVLSGANTYLFNNPYAHLPSAMHIKFTVQSGPETNLTPYFDTTVTGIDGAFYGNVSAEASPFLVYDFANQTPANTLPGETTFVTSISNPTDTEIEVPVEWRQYASHSFSSDLFKHTETQTVTIPALGSTSVSYTTIDQTESQLYVTATLTYGEHKNVLSMGVNREGVDEYSVIVPAVYPFPVTTGEATTLSVCVGMRNQLAPTDPLTLVMAAYDRSGEIIYQSASPVLLTNNLQKITDSFVATADYDYVQLSTILLRDNEIVYSSDNVFEQDSMRVVVVEDNGIEVSTANNPLYYVAAAITILTLIVIAGLLYMQKRRQSSDISTSDGSLGSDNTTTH